MTNVATPAAVEQTFIDWLARLVDDEGSGRTQRRTHGDPASTFWLGRLSTEEHVLQAATEFGDRLDPCALGIRVRPAGPPPWQLTAHATASAWIKETGPEHSDGSWIRLDPVHVDVTMIVDTTETTAGKAAFEAGFTSRGAPGFSAEIRIEPENWHDTPELVVQLVNTTPTDQAQLKDTHLYQAQLEIEGLPTDPFVLEALPDSYRYDRNVAAYGINCGIELGSQHPPTITTTDTTTVQTRRPTYWNSSLPQPDLTFARLAQDPIPPLADLVDALDEWNQTHWSDDALAPTAERDQWTPQMWQEARQGRAEADGEALRLRHGLHLLRDDELLCQAFELMNEAIAHSSAGVYDGWRPFQLGFLLGALAAITAPDHDADVVDTVWFATGGGKTETYLGLLVLAAFHDRLTGKSSGTTAWARFPLRLLSLQQTQRFADAIGGAEQVRRAHKLKGAPFGLGFLVGSAGTPNKIVREATSFYPDPESPGMPERYQVLLHCPFCHRADTLHMRFDRLGWRLAHVCTNRDCPWPADTALPVYVVDDEIYRFLPTVVVGTLDKAASVGSQAAMRGLVAAPLGLCSERGHGYTYAPRAKTPRGCLVPDCPGHLKALPQPARRYAPTFRLQDELHLLRDSLGAVDSHYESLLDHLQAATDAPKTKIVASSATLAGHDRQVDVLYRRRGRVFPRQGPRAGHTFWTTTTEAPLRRFVAVAPRGVTLEHVNDRIVDVLQTAVRRLHDHPDAVCRDLGIDARHAPTLVSDYGTHVIYGSTLYDVEAAHRSLATNSSMPINAEQLTGQTPFDDVRHILERLENPELDLDKRIHAVTASSMLSHGVDIARLNTMTMLGLPLSTAEFIQTTARIGRSHPGLVYVLHKLGRERDAQVFRQFEPFVTHGDRFIEPVPITRRSRRVLRRTLPGIVEARRLDLYEPDSPDQRLTTLDALQAYVTDHALTPAGEADVVARLLGFDDQELDQPLRSLIDDWFVRWFRNLNDPTRPVKWPAELSGDKPMTSLRDVDIAVPIHD